MKISRTLLNKILNETIEEELIFLNESKKKKSKKKKSKKKDSKKSSSKKENNGGLSSQAISILNDPMVNNAEVGRQLKAAGILHGSDDSIRSRVSKQRRKLRPFAPSEKTAIVNMSTGD